MIRKQICGVIVALSMAAVSARADSLELKNGSLIKGKFMGGSQTSITSRSGRHFRAMTSLMSDRCGSLQKSWAPHPAGSEVITKGDQVKIPSKTLLQFALQQSVTIPKHAA
jgi:hypothetical protein